MSTPKQEARDLASVLNFLAEALEKFEPEELISMSGLKVIIDHLATRADALYGHCCEQPSDPAPESRTDTLRSRLRPMKSGGVQ